MFVILWNFGVINHWIFPQCFLFISCQKSKNNDYNKFDENSIKLSRWVENTEGKGEIAHYEQFLLFPQCFQKDLSCRPVKPRACLGKG